LNIIKESIHFLKIIIESKIFSCHKESIIISVLKESIIISVLKASNIISVHKGSIIIPANRLDSYLNIKIEIQ